MSARHLILRQTGGKRRANAWHASVLVVSNIDWFSKRDRAANRRQTARIYAHEHEGAPIIKSWLAPQAHDADTMYLR